MSAVSQRIPHAAGPSRRREIAGILLLAVAVFLLLSLLSLQLGSGTLMGPGGAMVGLGMYAFIGTGTYLLGACIAKLSVDCLRGKPLRPRWSTAAALVGLVLAATVLLHLGFASHRLRGYSPGGLLGEYTAELLRAAIGTAGTLLLAITGLLVALVATTTWTLSGMVRTVAMLARRAAVMGRRAALVMFPPIHEEAEEATAGAARPMLREEEYTHLPVPPPVTTSAPPALPVVAGASSPTLLLPAAPAAPATGATVVSTPSPGSPHMPLHATPTSCTLPAIDPAAPQATAHTQPTARFEDLGGASPSGHVPVAQPAPSEKAHIAADAPAPGDAPLPISSEADRTQATQAPDMEPPAIIAPAPRRTPPKALPAMRSMPDYIQLGQGGFRMPELTLLDYDEATQSEIDRQAMLELATRLERTLADYSIKGRVSEIHPGPVVTMYEFVPQAGTKLSKITALSSDLAMALEALRVRIVAPIPGKAAVGIEVPNRVRETVYLKEIIGDDGFSESRAKLTLALGKDISGQPLSVDLAKMPHLLVAGTTGSGKSVSVNGMICSLLFKASPDEVKLILIDPKMLELSIYEGIPHLLLPVVTDPKKANLALRWAVDEMERRYELISKAGVRDIASYNKKLEASAAARPGRAGKAVVAALNDASDTIRMSVPPGASELAGDALHESMEAAGEIDAELVDELSARRMLRTETEAGNAPRKLPYIVIIIDEFADLMMVASKEVETSVARLAQKARAAGIHLLIATQRPSVDVITGLIKANFPSRIAFQVASKIDARTILDQQGAENLLGMGDMLFMDRGTAPRRIHGALVTDVEIHRLVEFLKSQGKPVYDMDILRPRDEEGENSEEESFADEMYDQAVAIVGETRQASISMIQRRLRIGYNRAARMVERMEREGIVGPADGARPREVLISHHAA